jgi:hypothetical protein
VEWFFNPSPNLSPTGGNEADLAQDIEIIARGF